MTSKPSEQNFKIIIHAVRFAGIMILFFGILLLFNIGDFASQMNLVEGGTHKIIGMVLAMFGIVEIILTPRILESVLGKNKK